VVLHHGSKKIVYQAHVNVVPGAIQSAALKHRLEDHNLTSTQIFLYLKTRANQKPNSWTYNFVEVSVYNVYITNQFQTTWGGGGGGSKNHYKLKNTKKMMKKLFKGPQIQA
jgi:hypothetical protein